MFPPPYTKLWEDCANRLPRSLAASAYTGFSPVAEPQNTQMFMGGTAKEGASELIIVLVFAHQFIGENPGGNNG
jgi:sirohydrochlorin ferrochelatase